MILDHPGTKNVILLSTFQRDYRKVIVQEGVLYSEVEILKLHI